MSTNDFSAKDLISIEEELTRIMVWIVSIKNSELSDPQIGRYIAIAHTHVETAVAYFRAYILDFAEGEIADSSD